MGVVRKRDYLVEYHYEIGDDMQFFILKTLFERCTKKQMENSVLMMIKDIEEKLGARSTLLEISDFTTGVRVRSEFSGVPGPVLSSEDIKRHERGDIYT